MAEFRSQLVDQDYARTTLALNAYRSLHVGRGRGFAEASYVADLALYRRLYAAVTVSREGPA
jgi:hypothetical protein